jgi:uncharacterized protein YjbI with pentapeptide repeats
VLCGLLVFLGCAEIGPGNPYDTETASAQQAKGGIRGTVRLPEPFDPARSAEIVVRLTSLSGLQAADQQVAPEGDGTFVFGDVPAGAYEVTALLAGFRAEPATIVLAIGQDVVLDPLTLVPDVGAAVEGTVRLAGAGEGLHGGTVIEARNTPYAAVSGSDGQFHLALAEGTHDLLFHHPGYESVAIEGFVVGPRALVRLPEAVQLVGAPGTVSGSVALSGYDDPEALLEVAVRLTPAGAPDADVLDETVPTVPDGGFTFSGLPAGRYRLVTSARGFTEDTREVTLPVGEHVEVGRIWLFPPREDSAPEKFGTLRGLAVLDSAAEGAHGGTRIEARGTPYWTETVSDGTYELRVPEGGYDLVFLHAGYGTEALSGLQVSPQSVTDAPPVRLTGQPGRVGGQIRLAGFDDPVRLQGVEIAVWSGDADGAAPPTARTSPDGSGAFLLDGLGAGAHRLEFRAEGFVPERREIVLPVGGAIDLGIVSLFPPREDSAPEMFGTLRGVAVLDAAADGAHGGTRIEARGTPYWTETVSDGTYELRVPEGGYDLVFLHAGYGTEALSGLQVSPQSVTDAPPVRLTGQPGRVGGQVRLAGFDDPVRLQGVEIAVWSGDADGAAPPTARTSPDGSGAFLLDGLGAGDHRLEFRAEGFVPERREVVLPVGGALDLGIVSLFPPERADEPEFFGALEGRALLLGAAEGAHGGTRVEAVGTPYFTETTAAGQYRLTLPAGRVTLTFTRRGYGQASSEAVRVEAGATAAVPEVVLVGQPGVVRGRVSLPGLDDPARLRAVQVTLNLEDAPPGAEPLQQGAPGADGRFVFAGVAAGRFEVRATLEGFGPEVRSVALEVGEDADVGLMALTPLAPGWAEGTATLERAAGAVHAGITVEAAGTGYSAQTTAAGRYRLELPAGTWDLTYRRAGYRPETRASVRIRAGAGTDPGAVELQGELGRVRGALVFPDGYRVEEWAPRVRVVATPAGGAPLPAVVPGEDGRFEVDGLGLGDHWLAFELAGFTAPPLPVVLEVGQVLDLGFVRLDALQLPGVGETLLEGTVRRAGVADADGHGGILVEVDGTPHATVSTSEGRYRLTVTPGPSLLAFRAEGYGLQTVDLGFVTEGESRRVDDVLLVAQPGAVTGAVHLGRFETPGRLAAVTLSLFTEGPDGPLVATTRPDGDGRFALAGIGPGRYRLTAQATGYGAAEQPQALGPGQSLDAGTLLLVHGSETPDAVLLSGRVRLAGAVDHGGTTIRADLAGTALTLGRTVTDAAGAFTLPAAPDEAYVLHVQRAGFVAPAPFGPLSWDPADARFETAAGAPAELDLDRPPPTGRIQVTVEVGPHWVKPVDRAVSVRLDGPGLSRVVAGVRDGPAGGTTFEALPAGEYWLHVERPGFSLAERSVTLAEGASEAVVLAIGLQSLPEARLDTLGVRLTRADLDAAAAAGTVFAGGRLAGVDLSGQDLSGLALPGGWAGVDFSFANLAGTGLVGQSLPGAVFFSANLSGADLSGAVLTAADFTGANLRGAVLGRGAAPATPCAGAGHAPIDLAEALFTQTDLSGAYLEGVWLRGANLSSALLAGVHATRACLAEADLSLSNLTGATFDRANLNSANLSLSNLTGAIFDRAYLSGANLINSNLTRASMKAVNLEGAQLQGAVLDRTRLGCDVPPLVDDDVCADRFEPNQDAAHAAALPVGSTRNLGLCAPNDLADHFTFTATAAREIEVVVSRYEDPVLTRLIYEEDGFAQQLGVTVTLTLPNNTSVSGRTRARTTYNGVGLQTFRVSVTRQAFPGNAVIRLPYELTIRTRDNRNNWTRVADPAACSTLRGANLSGAVLSGADLDGADLSSANLVGLMAGDANYDAFMPRPIDCLELDAVCPPSADANCETAFAHVDDGCFVWRTRLTDATLRSANLAGATLDHVDLRGAWFGRVKMRGVSCPQCSLTGARFDASEVGTAAILDRVDLSGNVLAGVDFTHARLEQAMLDGTFVVETRFDSAHLGGASFDACYLRDSRLTGALVTGTQFTDCELTDVDAGNTWASDLGGGPSFRGSNLTRAHFAGAVWSDDRNSGPDFGDATLIDSDFNDLGGNGRCGLYAASFSRAFVLRTNFAACDLQYGIFAGTSFGSSNFSGANLRWVTGPVASFLGNTLSAATLCPNGQRPAGNPLTCAFP